MNSACVRPHVVLGQPLHDIWITFNKWLQDLDVARDLLSRSSLAGELVDTVSDELVSTSLLLLPEVLSSTHGWPLNECCNILANKLQEAGNNH